MLLLRCFVDARLRVDAGYVSIGQANRQVIPAFSSYVIILPDVDQLGRVVRPATVDTGCPTPPSKVDSHLIDKPPLSTALLT